VAAAHARPAVAQVVLVVDARGRGHQRLFPDRPAAAGPGALRPDGRPAALVVFGRGRGRRAAHVSVRRRRGRVGRRGAGGGQALGAAGRKPERAYGRGPAFEHGVHQRAVVLGGHRRLAVGRARAVCGKRNGK